MKQLEWNVFIRDFNSRTIQKYNVFNNSNFYEGLKKIKKEISKYYKAYPIQSKNLFIDKLDNACQYCFWSKCEYEIVLTDVFCGIDKQMIDKIKSLPTDRLWTATELAIHKKIDIYDQLKLNWSVFVDYIWNNLKLIKMR